MTNLPPGAGILSWAEQRRRRVTSPLFGLDAVLRQSRHAGTVFVRRTRSGRWVLCYGPNDPAFQRAIARFDRVVLDGDGSWRFERDGHPWYLLLDVTRHQPCRSEPRTHIGEVASVRVGMR